MSKFACLAALAAVLLLSGCSSSGRGSSSVAFKPVDTTASPEVLVANAVESRASLSSLSGKGVMRIVDTPNRFGLTVNANVVADDTKRMRIRGDKLAGSIQAFDIVMLGEEIGFYVPMQKTLYYGKVNELQNLTFRFDPDEVLRQMLSPDASLLLKKWRYVPSENQGRGRPSEIILEEEVPGNRPRMQLALDSRTGMILSVSHLDPSGRPFLVKNYGDYRSLDRGKGKRVQDDFVFPYLMSLSWPRDQRSMELHFKAVEGDAIVLEEDFDLATSDDTRYLPLGEATISPELSDDPLAVANTDYSTERPL
jgi:hypothetical protein